jgi:CHAT domain-containing protein
MANLPQASILHLACHGHQDMNEPLASGFVMQNKMLRVCDLLSLKLPHAFLAFLSACETAKGDEKQRDQAIHLAATMLAVGFKSVVATMW